MKHSMALLRKFHVLLRQVHGAEDHKAEILAPYGVSSASDLTAEQLAEVVTALQQQTDPPKPIRKKRSKVLDLLTQLGIYTAGGSWAPVNSFLENPRIAGKRLYQMNDEELEALIKKLYLFKRRRAAQLEKEMRLATEN